MKRVLYLSICFLMFFLAIVSSCSDSKDGLEIDNQEYVNVQSDEIFSASVTILSGLNYAMIDIDDDYKESFKAIVGKYPKQWDGVYFNLKDWNLGELKDGSKISFKILGYNHNRPPFIDTANHYYVTLKISPRSLISKE